MIQSGGFIAYYTTSNISNRSRSIKKSRKNCVTANNAAPWLAEKATWYYVNRGINELNKKFTVSKGSGTTIANNEGYNQNG